MSVKNVYAKGEITKMAKELFREERAKKMIKTTSSTML